jgi:hypothetical protein
VILPIELLESLSCNVRNPWCLLFIIEAERVLKNNLHGGPGALHLFRRDVCGLRHEQRLDGRLVPEPRDSRGEDGLDEIDLVTECDGVELCCPRVRALEQLLLVVLSSLGNV